ncbi:MULTISPECIES: hypothetical protein [unclassified Streptomyces]|uniref:hypothetical protein n=1 Tax=unclassified Streptomyces TaxID=2593676 RepID=UPI00099D252B|nr:MULTISPECIES: hypothetical protein [unclassified Streptomyces]
MTPARGLRRAAALAGGALWWWAVLRLAFAADAGVLEGAVAAGGWGLSVLPVHCVPKAQAVGALATGRWRRAWRSGAAPGARPGLCSRAEGGGAGPRPGSGGGGGAVPGSGAVPEDGGAQG